MKKILVMCMSLSLLSGCIKINRNTKESNFERVVVLGQSAIELLLELEMGDKIVGVAYFDNLPDSIERLKLPILSNNWTDKETILTLKPDLIYAMEAAFRTDRIGSQEFWNSRGVKTFIVDNYKEEKSFENYCADIYKTGELFNIQYQTDIILKRIAETRKQRSKRRIDHPQRVLHLSFIGNNQMYYYPPGMCLIDEIIADCGGTFIDLGDKSFIISTEAIIESQPDKIIITQFREQSGESISMKLINDRILRHLPAIKDKKMIEVDYTQAIRGATDMEKIYTKIYNFLKE